MRKRITRCLALLLAVVMVLSVMPVAMAEETTQTQTYTKVTEAPADWSGTYLIVSEGDKLIMDGSLDKLDVEGNKVDVTITDSKITGDYAKYAFTVEPMTGGYAIKSASGKYISGKSGSNKLNSGSTQSLNTIELTSGKVIVTSDGTTLQYNNAAKNGTRFRYYKSQNQQPISLYKIETAAKQQVATPTATPAAGEVAKGTKVEFKCKTEGAKISYKTTGEYTEYTDPVEVNADTTFTVKATKDGMDDSDEVKFAYTVKAEEPVQSLFKDGEQIVIYNPANMKALSTEYSGFYNKGTDVTLTNGTLTGYTEADVWTVGVNADGSYTFSTKDGKKLSMGEKFTSTPLDDVNTAWKVSAAATTGCYYIQNAVRGNYLEWYADKSNWSSYNKISDELLFAQAFYRVRKSGIVTSLSAGDTVVVFNPANMKALSTGVEGIGFAIPTASIRPIVNALLSDGRVSGRVSIGITVGAVSSAASEYYDLPEGLYISAVAEGSDAEKKGIQSGDMLLAVNGQAVTTTYDVSAVKDGLKVGDTITLTIYRDGKTFDVDVRLVDTNDLS